MLRFAILSCVTFLSRMDGVASKEFKESCAEIVESNSNTEEEIQRMELQEAELAKMKLLQVRKPSHGTDAISGDHKYLLVRPCQRWAGDGRSGLSRHRVTGECCGDGACSLDRWESYETCRLDCHSSSATTSNSTGSVVTLPPTTTTLFGTLEGLEHDEYHCEDGYDHDGFFQCSKLARQRSIWLEDLLERKEKGELPFEFPPAGSIAVEFGSGLGQDSRNMAKLAGFSVTSVDVSAGAVEQAIEATSEEFLGFGPSKIEFVAYDAFALPEPTQRVDYFFDATVYCGLRQTYLSRAYDVWARIFTPGHTLVNIQCWALEGDDPNKIAKARRDMEADFEPYFDILHSESCEKNQGGAGWCFYMKMRSESVRDEIAHNRLKLQRAARDGDVEYVRGELAKRSGHVPDAEYQTLSYIAQANGHSSLLKFLQSVGPDVEEKYFALAYGADEDIQTVEEEDQIDGQKSRHAKTEVAQLKAEWERAELGEQLLGEVPWENRSEP